MHYVITCKDKPGHLPVRMEARPDHIKYLNDYLDHILCAGPTLDEQGNPTGSVLIMEFDNLADAEVWAAQDPYAKVDLFETVTITAWKKVLPTPE